MSYGVFRHFVCTVKIGCTHSVAGWNSSSRRFTQLGVFVSVLEKVPYLDPLQIFYSVQADLHDESFQQLSRCLYSGIVSPLFTTRVPNSTFHDL